MNANARRPALFLIGLLIVIAWTSPGIAQDGASTAGLPDALSERQWDALERAVDRGLFWLAGQQEGDGQYASKSNGQPAVTSLAVMAFLSRGHRPGSGPYGPALEKAIDFVLDCQRENGLFTFEDAPPPYIKRQASHNATYNHAIAGLMLGEVYGMCRGEQSLRVRDAIDQALNFTWRLQAQPKDHPHDVGGWRYLYDRDSTDSDLSVTGWQLMFLRSAKNAEFDVPKQFVDSAMAYVERCYIDHHDGIFTYEPGKTSDANHAMTGIGAVSMALGGKYDDPRVRRAGDWLLQHPLTSYSGESRYHYTAYYCTMTMAQLGGDYWKQFFPIIVHELVDHQDDDGSWYLRNGRDKEFGRAYYTSLAVLTLTPPYQLLPIYQR